MTILSSLDRLLGRISMVLFTAVVLALLLAVAGVQAGLGSLPYDWAVLLPAAGSAVVGSLLGTIAGALVTGPGPTCPPVRSRA